MYCSIYVISESDDNPRLKKIKSQFNRYYSMFNIIKAVMGGKLSAAEYYKYVCANFNYTQRILSPAEVGCALSHLSAYDAIIKQQVPAIVFEDDIIGNDAALAQANMLAEQLGPNDIVLLGGLNGLVEKKYIKYLSDESALVTDTGQLAKKVDPLSYPYLGRNCCTLLGVGAAQIIREKQHACLHVADAWGYFSEQTALNFYYIELIDHPIIDEHLDSYIEQERKSIKYIPSYQLALRNMVRLVSKKVNQFRINRM